MSICSLRICACVCRGRHGIGDALSDSSTFSVSQLRHPPWIILVSFYCSSFCHLRATSRTAVESFASFSSSLHCARQSRPPRNVCKETASPLLRHIFCSFSSVVCDNILSPGSFCERLCVYVLLHSHGYGHPPRFWPTFVFSNCFWGLCSPGFFFVTLVPVFRLRALCHKRHWV